MEIDRKHRTLPLGTGRRVGVVVSHFNQAVTESLWFSCRQTLLSAGVREKDITVVWVPGAFELPWAAQRLARRGRVDVVICLGCVIRGQTPHDRYISAEVARGIAEVSRQMDLPVIFGVLTPLNERQARARSGKNSHNKGAEAARAALEMALIAENL